MFERSGYLSPGGSASLDGSFSDAGHGPPVHCAVGSHRPACVLGTGAVDPSHELEAAKSSQVHSEQDEILVGPSV